MEKIWFVIRNDKHLGPFSQEDLESLQKKKKIDSNTKIWKEGFESSRSYSDILLDLAGVPDLPPLNEKKEIKEIKENKEIVQFADDSEEEKVVEEKVVEEKRKRNKSKPLWIFFFSLPLLLITAFYFSLPLMNQVNRPAKMLLRDFQALEQMIEKGYQNNRFEFYLSKDRSTLWLGTNTPLEGDIVLKFSSIKNRHLGEDEVEAIAYGKLKNYMAEFENISFSEGDHIHEGFYSIEVYTPKPLNIPFLKKSFLKNQKSEFRYFDTAYLGHLSLEKFKQVLKKKQMKEKRNGDKFWGELKQKYLTIKMISLQIREAIHRVFEHPDKPWKEQVAKFEDDYKLKYGNFFTSFVIANEKSYSVLTEKEFKDKLDIISNYTRLSKLAKSIGTQTMNVLYTLEAAEKQTIELQEKSEMELKTIIELCDQKIDMIDIEKLAN
jgi:hypothetical protein